MVNFNSIINTLKKVKLFNHSSTELVQNYTRNGEVNVFKDVKKNFYFLDKILTSNNSYFLKKYHKVNPINKNWKHKFNGKRYNTVRLNDNFKRIDILKKYINKKTILDFGCGFGEFANITKNYSKETYVYEKSVICRKFIKDNFKKIKLASSLANYNNFFDSIILIHSFHYLDKPLDYLKFLKKKLKQNGTLILEVPHSNDILLSKFNIQEFKDFTFCIESLILHNELTLKSFLKKTGFKKVKIIRFQRYNLNNHFGWLIKGKPGGHDYFKSFFNAAQQETYKKYLINNNLTDTLIVIAKK